jgi:hypothetical protein
MAKSWLDDLLGKTVLLNGSALPDRKLLNFIQGVGVGLTIVDNPATLSTDVTLASVSRMGVDPLVPLGGGGYPSNPSYVIASGVSFLRGTPADGDSVRFFGAGGGEQIQVAYLEGRITNVTAAQVALWPLATQHIFLNGADQGVGNPVTIDPGGTVWWALDVALNAHVSTSGVAAAAHVVNKPAAYSLTAFDSGNVFNDHGASGDVVYSLPAAHVDLSFEIYHTGLFKLTLQPAGTDVIHVLDDASTASTGDIHTVVSGGAIKLVCTDLGHWRALYFVGPWGTT